MDKYDENITENKFLKILKIEHKDIFEEAVNNSYFICIPKADIIEDVSLDIILDHILLPTKNIESKTHTQKEYVTKRNKKLVLCNAQLKSMENEDRRVAILFEETFYEEKFGKYKIVCIDNYISSLFHEGYEATVQSELLLNNQNLKHFRNVNDFIDHITKFTERFSLIDQIDQYITDFLAFPFSKINPPKIEYLRKEVDTILQKSLDYIRDAVIKLRDYERGTLRVCIESYILHSLYNVVFQYTASDMATKDEKLNRLLHSLKELSLSKFETQVCNLNCILSAKYELAAINNFKFPFGKLQCIRKAIECFESSKALTSDELLSSLVFTIIKCNVSNWFANLAYIKNYSFTLESSDEYSFILSTFEASLIFIHSEDIHRKGYDDMSSDIFFDCNEESSFQIDNFNPRSKNFLSEIIYSLYDNIKKNNLVEVKTILEAKKLPNVPQNFPNEEELCHPLCICSKCKLLIGGASKSNAMLDFDYQDENLMSPLHIATWYGSVSIVEYLLSKNASCNSQNVAGMTPLHIAAYRGYQTILLLLLHPGCDINKVDKEGNTALLLSCRAGHDSCVKALIFYAESVGFDLDFSTKNAYGETALHLASYWGYKSIVEFLLIQPSVDAECLAVKNMRHQTPFECSHNEAISYIIKQATENIEENIQTSLLLLNFDDENKNISNNTLLKDAVVTLDISRNSAHDEITNAKKNDTLSKIIEAIYAGDTKLTCFYLEINDSIVQNLNEHNKCHPLCQCAKCSNIPFVQVKSNVSLINSIGEVYGPLHMAVLHENSELCHILLQNGADSQIVTKNEKSSSLHLAVDKENSEILKLLIKFNADINCVDIVGNTPLHLCCIRGWKEGAIILIDSGTKLRGTNKDGSSPKEEADKHGHIELVEILIRKMSESFG